MFFACSRVMYTQPGLTSEKRLVVWADIWAVTSHWDAFPSALTTDTLPLPVSRKDDIEPLCFFTLPVALTWPVTCVWSPGSGVVASVLVTVVSMDRLSETEPCEKGVLLVGSVPTSVHVGVPDEKLTSPLSDRVLDGPRARAEPPGSQARAEARAPQAVMATVRRSRPDERMAISPKDE
jgi:hypothetical protein